MAHIRKGPRYNVPKVPINGHNTKVVYFSSNSSTDCVLCSNHSEASALDSSGLLASFTLEKRPGYSYLRPAGRPAGGPLYLYNQLSN